MSIEIKRIYLENYKLFTLKELTFSDNLCVFDGPNGYGKTSIFDAIEFLITGSISRIQESEVIAANLSYSKNCLANGQSSGEQELLQALHIFFLAVITIVFIFNP